MTKTYQLEDYARRGHGNIFVRQAHATHDAPARVRLAVHPTTGHVQIQGKRPNDKPFLRRFFEADAAHDWLVKHHYVAEEAADAADDVAEAPEPAEPDTNDAWLAMFERWR
jgi:hypothetical protein